MQLAIPGSFLGSAAPPETASAAADDTAEGTSMFAAVLSGLVSTATDDEKLLAGAGEASGELVHQEQAATNENEALTLLLNSMFGVAIQQSRAQVPPESVQPETDAATNSDALSTSPATSTAHISVAETSINQPGSRDATQSASEDQNHVTVAEPVGPSAKKNNGSSMGLQPDASSNTAPATPTGVAKDLATPAANGTGAGNPGPSEAQQGIVQDSANTTYSFDAPGPASHSQSEALSESDRLADSNLLAPDSSAEAPLAGGSRSDLSDQRDSGEGRKQPEPALETLNIESAPSSEKEMREQEDAANRPSNSHDSTTEPEQLEIRDASPATGTLVDSLPVESDLSFDTALVQDQVAETFQQQDGPRDAENAASDTKQPHPLFARPATAAAWLRSMLANHEYSMSLVEGWQVLNVKLDDQQGDLTVRARREDEKVSVSVGFSDPALRAVIQANAQSIEQTLEAQYQTSVDLSFFTGDEGGERASDHARQSAESGSGMTSNDTVEHSSPSGRRPKPVTALREWVV